MPSFSNSTQAQATNTVRSFQCGIQAAADAQARFEQLSQDATQDPSDRDNYASGALQAGKDRDLLQARLDAYMNDSPLGDVNPPDDATTTQVATLAAQVRAMAQANHEATDVLSALTQVLHLLGSV